MSTPLWVAAAFNVIRNISIGSLMMPLLTWGTSNVHPTKVADASSLLTSLRTIAGSIGSAIFVGIMTVVSMASADVYGDNAMMHGMNVSFLWMTVGAVVLNRVASPDFPNTIAEVIYQPSAFDAVEDKQFYLTPNETALNAARDALNGWDPTNGALYYWNPATATSRWIWSIPITTTIGRHVFGVK